MILIHISLAGCLTLSRMPHNPEEQTVAGHTQFSKEMFAPPGPSTSAPHPPSGWNTPSRSLHNWRLKTCVANDDFIDVFSLDVLNKLCLEVSLELHVRNDSIDWMLQYTRTVTCQLGCESLKVM